jgi:hypothetical protein
MQQGPQSDGDSGRRRPRRSGKGGRLGLGVAVVIGSPVLGLCVVLLGLVLGLFNHHGMIRAAEVGAKEFSVSLGVAWLCGCVMHAVQPVASVLIGGSCIIWLCCWRVAKSPVSGTRWAWSRVRRSAARKGSS